MRLYPAYTVRQALGEYSITFFTLLAAGVKLEIYNKRWQLSVSAYPHMEDEVDREKLKEALSLPDDLLNGILEDEKLDDISKLKQIFEGQ